MATPIGHLADLSARAADVLRRVDLIAAEDTRTSRVLLDHVGSSVRCVALHAHNEREAGDALVQRVLHGARVALITDAGTPAISDPGARVVEAAHRAGVRVIPVPGASAITALASAAGLGSGRFRFDGFLPTHGQARARRLDRLAAGDDDTIVFEAPHRIHALARDLAARLQPDREVVVGRELTKRFEQIVRLRVDALPGWLADDPNHARGEFALVVLAAHGRGADDAAGAGDIARAVADGPVGDVRTGDGLLADGRGGDGPAGDGHEDASHKGRGRKDDGSESGGHAVAGDDDAGVIDSGRAADAGPSELGVRAMRVLAAEMPPRAAARLAAKISGDRANDLYRHRPQSPRADD